MPRQKSLQLDRAFNAAYKTVKANQQALNAMDGYNGNHGDNTARNLKVISQAVKGAKGRPPSDQLRQAAEELAARGQGGTTPHYVNGLREAASRFEGQERLGRNDVPALLQSLMGQVPAQGTAAQSTAGQGTAAQGAAAAGNQNDIGDLLNALGGQGPVQPTTQAHPASPIGPSAAPAAGGDILSALLNLAGQSTGASSASQHATSQPAASQDPFGALLGGGQGGSQDPFAALLGGGVQSPSTPPQPSQDPFGALISGLVPDKPGFDLADILQAGSAFMGAQAQGADTGSAAMQAVMAAIRGVNPLNASSPRTASGGLIAQSILDSVSSKK